MNSAAAHSAKLIAEFEKLQEDQQEVIPEYPSQHPFGASEPGPFGGSGGATIDRRDHHSTSSRTAHRDDAFAADNEMSNFADWDSGYAGADASEIAQYGATEAGPSTSRHPRALTQYDYPGGWGAQTFNGVGGLTQDSASRVATLQAKLNQRLGPEYLSQRPGPGGGKKLTYIEGWKLVDLANEVFGFNGWSTTIVRLDVDFLDCSPDGTRFNAGVSCVVRVTLRDGAFHEDIGYGSAENARQKHAALEKGKKEAVTDATKRALKNFGKLLGNCTYDHQYSANALKVSNPPPKFDASELHRRPELRPPPPAAPQPPQSAPAPAPARMNPPQPQPQPQPQPSRSTNPPVPQTATRAPAPALNGQDVSASTVQASVRSGPTVAPPQQPITTNGSNSTAKSGNDNNASKDEILERQQRSMLARQAFLERQQAETRKAGPTESHQVVTNANGGQRATAPAAEVEFGSDSFDDGLNDVLAGYDETSMGDAEAASRALEMEIDEAHRPHHSAEHDDVEDTSGSVLHPNYGAADDSGVAFADGSHAMQIKQEKVKAHEVRRSTSPVKQVKMEAAKAPRRAGSVGRFVSPPPQVAIAAPSAAPSRVPFKTGATLAPGSGAYTSGANVMRNGTSSLSAASTGASASRNAGMNAPSRRMHSTTLDGMGGVEGAAGSAATAGESLRGLKRPNEVLGEAQNGRRT
ncbi:DNA repair and recombination protein RAD52 [Pseudozyma hubeiensis]|nr:DNA repair and recombination protein RAD52 [Pseudozyma hubeiensis]